VSRFPSIAVDAISEMGDNLKINILKLEESSFILVSKDFTFVCPTETSNTSALTIQTKYILLVNTVKNNGGIEGVTQSFR
jgi:peroxiredoxin (alkyl hydroperoxide reductase subunit C)